MSLPYAAGSLYSTVDDLVKWDEALYSEKLLKEETFAKMTTAGLSDYGYGLQMRTVDGRPAQAHGGGINGFNTYMIRLPGEHLMAVALANQNGQGPDAIAAALARIYLGADVPPRVRKKAIRLSAEQLDRYSGNYQLAPNFVMKVWREGERMMTQATGQSSIEIFASAEDRFFPAAVEAELVFERGSDGRVTGLTLHQNGRSMPAKRTSE
jgi:CubicO group peptidase (beta-lactamase class C family)